MRSKRKKLTLAKPFSLGVMSKSAPALARKIPGFTKLAWPSSLLERRAGIKLPGEVSSTPEPVRRMPSRFQKLNNPPAKLGSSTMESKPRARAVAGIGVAGSIESGDAIANPVAIVRQLDGGHLRVDGHGPAGDGIEGVFPERLVKSVGEIDAADVAAAEPAKISDANAVQHRADALIDDVADGRGAHQETVVVVVEARVVFVECADKFRGVAGKEKILEIDIAENDLLMAAVEGGVEAAVGIFFEKIEIGGVVFDAVAVKIAEDADGGLFVDEKKSAKIGVELLDSGAHGNEIVVGAEIGKFYFHEGFLKADVGVEAVGAVSHVGADDAEFADVEIVEADFRSDANAPVDWLEGGVAVKQIEGESEGLIEESLLAFAEESAAAGARGADVAGRRNTAAVEKRFRGGGDIQESLLAEEGGPDGLVALEAVAIERVKPAGTGVEILTFFRIAAIVRLRERPAIGDGVVNVSDGWEIVGSKFLNVGGVGIEAMAKLAVASGVSILALREEADLVRGGAASENALRRSAWRRARFPG